MAGCNILTLPLPSNARVIPIVQRLPYTGRAFTYTANLGTTARNVYFVFSNPSLTTNPTNNLTVNSASTAQILVDGRAIATAPAPLSLAASYPNPKNLREFISEYNRTSWTPGATKRSVAPTASSGPSNSGSGPVPSAGDTAGNTANFVTDIDPLTGYSTYGISPPTTVAATCQYYNTVTYPDGRTRSISIWVDNSELSYYPGQSGSSNTTNTAILDLARSFIDGATSGDIYRWDTAVVGEPWGPAAAQYSNLIPWDSKNTITILLTNLNATGSYTATVGPWVVGFFWNKDNFTSSYEPDSNQRLMFYIDATLYATTGTYPSAPPSGTWARTEYWPQQVYSTLAHEFQHMIQFYQKQVTYGVAGTDAWINEMCSMIMEDLVANSNMLNDKGPRGVSPSDGTAGTAGNIYGRIPDFNQSYNDPLVVTSEANMDIYEYAVAYAFGAWLARNYGGASLLHNIVDSPNTDQSAIVNAVNAYTGGSDTFETLLQRWSAAVLMSQNQMSLPGYTYNSGGWFTSGAGGFSYELGSINFFNYSPSLYLASGNGTLQASAMNPTSNYYYQAASAQTGSKSWTVSLPQGIYLDVVIQ